MNKYIVILTLALSVPSTSAFAQDDQESGLFARAKQLPLLSQSAHVDISNGSARVEIIQSFMNPGGNIAQADYIFHLPSGSSVEEFGFWHKGIFQKAKVKAKAEAQRAHRKAAREKRTTALLQREGNIHKFSVYPLLGRQIKRVRVVLQVPVVMEMGRAHLKVPLEHFISQSPLVTPLSVSINSPDEIVDIGVDVQSKTARLENGLIAALEHEPISANIHRVSKNAAKLIFSTARSARIWWTAKQDPLSIRAESVELENGELGVELTSILSDAKQWATPLETHHILVDASRSMLRRQHAVKTVIERYRQVSTAPVMVHFIDKASSSYDINTLPFDEAWKNHGAFYASWKNIEMELQSLGCNSSRIKCLVLSDPQLMGINEAMRAETDVLLLADSHEIAWWGQRLAPGIQVHLFEADGTASLLAKVDRMIRPVLILESFVQGSQSLFVPGFQNRKTAEGGMGKLYLSAYDNSPITISTRIQDEIIERTISVFPKAIETKEGRRIRKAMYRQLIAQWLRDYANTNDQAIKQRIVKTSIREQIPTRFTAMQVDAPKTSLYAIKPGDPILSVSNELGLKKVVAHYPFGEIRELKFDAEKSTFTDRFLVPRAWRDQVYRIQIFKYFEDKSVRAERAYYRIDSQVPSAMIQLDTARDLLTIDTGDFTYDVSSVSIRTSKGGIIELSPVKNVWSVERTEIGTKFEIVVRDRAGNRAIWKATLRGKNLKLKSGKMPDLQKPVVRLPQKSVIRSSDETRALSVNKNEVRLRAFNKVYRFPYNGVAPRSLRLSALIKISPSSLLFGTEAGDIILLDCPDKSRSCSPRFLDKNIDEHVINGFGRRKDGTVLVGVSGRGLYAIDKSLKLKRSQYRFGTRFVTAVHQRGRDILVGTAYSGLWRIVGRRAIKSRFPVAEVVSINTVGGRVLIQSSQGSYARISRDRFRKTKLPQAFSTTASRAITDGLVHAGRTYLAGFDHGVTVKQAGRTIKLRHSKRPRDNYINRLAVFASDVWMATEGGLFRLTSEGDEIKASLVLKGAVYGLSASEEYLAVAASKGLFIIDSFGQKKRIGFQAGIGEPRLGTVAWHKGTLYAGGLDGLYRFDDKGAHRVSSASGMTAGWITALYSDKKGLVVGTYDEGVFIMNKGIYRVIDGLSDLWVPPHAIKRSGEKLYIGGLGMPPVSISDSGVVQTLAVPVRDINGFMSQEGQLQVLTSDGVYILTASQTPMARR